MVSINSTITKRNSTKLLSPWISKTQKHYNRNAINGNLHWSKRILSNFDEEILLKVFMKVGYSLRFMNRVINQFQKGKTQKMRFGILELRNRVTQRSYAKDVTLRVTNSKLKNQKFHLELLTRR